MSNRPFHACVLSRLQNNIVFERKSEKTHLLDVISSIVSIALFEMISVTI